MLLCFTIHAVDNYTYLKHGNNGGIDRLRDSTYVLRWMVTTGQVKILRTDLSAFHFGIEIIEVK